MLTALLIASAYSAVGAVVALALNGADAEPMRPWEVAYVAGIWPAPVMVGLARLLGLVD